MSVERGTEALLTRRREILAQGAEPIGWKIGFNIPEIQAQLGISEPVIGHLISARELTGRDRKDVARVRSACHWFRL